MAATVTEIDTIFCAAIELASPEERADYVERACGSNHEVRRRVEELLAAHFTAGEFLERAPAMAMLPNNGFENAAPGSLIGPYKLLQQIGEGGFGVVFLAEQERPVKRRVALKVIKPGMDTRQVIARFEAERQALAMMDHPNIAKVLDAGTTGARSHPEGTRQGAGSPEEFLLHAPCSPLPASSGRPYFVMELVQGAPITEYCDQCNLATIERLELFITVCQAVQHAHQKGIIHRDIKPTNILVSMQDGRPTPKIIDFGVAKAIDQRLTEHTLTTAFAQMVGTPLYMSPEQAELNPLGVDTRSDIYSLGVVLYELLTGATPFDKDRLHAVPYDELRRIIREEEPPRPSARFSTLAADLSTTVAEHRRTDTRRLQQTVRGELDWIVMKCLEKDRNRRYETAGSLARDIERYLHDEPVQACPPSVGFRLKKFVRRNKVVAAFVTLLLMSVAGLSVSNIAIRRERDAKTTALARAQTVSDLLQELLGSADAANAKGADYKVRDLLDDFSAGLGGQLAEQREVEADIRATIGRAYRSLKLPEKGQPHFEKAVELRRQINGAYDDELAAILVDQAWNLQDQQRYAEAEAKLNEALDIYRLRGVTGGPLFHALEILQHVLINAGRDEDAERVTQRALDVARQGGQEFADQANLLHRYADLKIAQGHYAEAEQLARQAVDMHRRLHGDGHPETGWSLRVLSRALSSQQKLAEAESAARESLTIFRRLFPADHPNIRDTNYQFRTVLEALGDKPALVALAKEEAEEATRSDRPENRVRLAGLLLNDKPRLLLTDDPKGDRKQEARRLIQWAIEEYGQVAVDSPRDLDRRVRAALGYVGVINISPATKGYSNEEVDEVNRRLEAELPKLLAAFPDSSDCQFNSAIIYREWGNSLFHYDAYLPVADHAFSAAQVILERLSLSDPKRPHLWLQLADTYSVLGEIRWRSARLEDADAVFRQCIEILDQHAAEIEKDPDGAVGIFVSCIRLAYFLAGTHREEEAAEFVRRAVHATQRLTKPIQSAAALWLTAPLQLRLGDEAGYRVTCKALVEVPDVGIDDLTKARAILTWCLAPDAVEDRSLPRKRAEELAANNSVDQPHIVPYALGAALYRAGQFDRAVDELEKSIAAYPGDPRLGFESINSQRLLLAMTKWQQGNKDEARRLLAETEPAADQELQSPSVFYFSKVDLEVYRREAQALIEPKEADEAVENENTNNE